LIGYATEGGDEMPDARQNLTLVPRISGATTVVEADGSIDMSTSPLLEAEVTDLTTAGRIVIIDMTAVSVCDSTGLGTLVRLHRHATKVGARFAIRGPRAHVADMIMMTGIGKVLEVIAAQP